MMERNFASKRWWDALKLDGQRRQTWQEDCQRLVRYGVRYVKQRPKEDWALKFNLFNQDEADLVSELMKPYPEIKYTRNWLKF